MAKKRASSRRTEAGYRQRNVDVREPEQRFLIICEGEKTEPNYFKRFRVPRKVLPDAQGIGKGKNPIELVELARSKRAEGDYNQVWCVFDLDDIPADIFNRAIALAQQYNINVAYSNEAFELWYLLHYDLHTAAITRDQYCTKLSHKLKRPYKKNDSSLFDVLEDLQDQAIKYATKLLEQHQTSATSGSKKAAGRIMPSNPASLNPSTTVHWLVEELRKHSRP